MHRFHGIWPFGDEARGDVGGRHGGRGRERAEGPGEPRDPSTARDPRDAFLELRRVAHERAHAFGEHVRGLRGAFGHRHGPGHDEASPSFGELVEEGRARFGGPRDRGPFGGRGRGLPPFGFGGGPGGFGFRSGRKLSATDLQLVLMALIDEKARHGYDLIKLVEERSNGFYAPSPGVIYPALTYLEEAGDAVAEAEGSRKLYRLTEAGRAHLAERRAEADALLAQLAELGKGMDRLREAFAGGLDPEDVASLRGAWAKSPEVLEAARALREALSDRHGATRKEWLRIAAVLRKAAEEIRGARDDEQK